MSSHPEAKPRPADLEKTILHRVTQSTAGRIQDLEVAVDGDRLEIRGKAVSYHLKQIAIQAVMEEMKTLSGSRQIEIAVQIVVSPPQCERPIDE
jgi:hypothetical protein